MKDLTDTIADLKGMASEDWDSDIASALIDTFVGETDTRPVELNTTIAGKVVHGIARRLPSTAGTLIYVPGIPPSAFPKSTDAALAKLRAHYQARH